MDPEQFQMVFSSGLRLMISRGCPFHGQTGLDAERNFYARSILRIKLQFLYAPTLGRRVTNSGAAPALRQTGNRRGTRKPNRQTRR